MSHANLPSNIKYVVTCSCGNDSIALIQYMEVNFHGQFCVLYNNTGWARDDWPARVEETKDACRALNICFYTTLSEGMISLVKRKKGWPMPASKMQFCTGVLKEQPSLIFYNSIDPERRLIIVTGRRREESINRSILALKQPNSDKHGAVMFLTH